MSSTIKVNNIQNLAGDDSGIDLSTNDQIILKTANTTALTIDSSQDTTVAGNIKKTGDLTLDVSGDITLDADGGDFIFKDGGSGDEVNKTIRFSTPSHDTDEENVQILQVESESSSNQISFGGGTSALNSATTMRFLTSSVDTTTGTERMRIVSGGNVLVGTTNQSPAEGSGTGIRLGQNGGCQFSADGQPAIEMNRATDNGNIMTFRRDGTLRGRIEVGSSSTSYVTSSDYRLKENVSYDFDATTRLKQLKPARFNFIEDADVTVDGFLAHEVSSIVPEAISGEKDAMTKEVLYVDGDEIPEGKKVGDVKEASKIDPQGIDQAKLVPLLTKALQEQQAIIEALTDRITALEGK